MPVFILILLRDLPEGTVYVSRSWACTWTTPNCSVCCHLCLRDLHCAQLCHHSRNAAQKSVLSPFNTLPIGIAGIDFRGRLLMDTEPVLPSPLRSWAALTYLGLPRGAVVCLHHPFRFFDVIIGTWYEGVAAPGITRFYRAPGCRDLQSTKPSLGKAAG
ncbi:hypothetical protein FQR65_LT19514 [Abscondita terminalis]|nr:hypothetical protein FQR65_LT19514 [Abscondita terminalis]